MFGRLLTRPGLFASPKHFSRFFSHSHAFEHSSIFIHFRPKGPKGTLDSQFTPKEIWEHYLRHKTIENSFALREAERMVEAMEEIGSKAIEHRDAYFQSKQIDKNKLKQIHHMFDQGHASCKIITPEYNFYNAGGPLPDVLFKEVIIGKLLPIMQKFPAWAHFHFASFPVLVDKLREDELFKPLCANVGLSDGAPLLLNAALVIEAGKKPIITVYAKQVYAIQDPYIEFYPRTDKLIDPLKELKTKNVVEFNRKKMHIGVHALCFDASNRAIPLMSFHKYSMNKELSVVSQTVGYGDLASDSIELRLDSFPHPVVSQNDSTQSKVVVLNDKGIEEECSSIDVVLPGNNPYAEGALRVFSMVNLRAPKAEVLEEVAELQKLIEEEEDELSQESQLKK